MVWFVIAVIVIIAVTIVAMVVAARTRNRRLERMVRVEITNRGNVASRYQLRVEDPDDLLSAQFMMDGDPLPGLDSFVDDLEDQEPVPAARSAAARPEAPPASEAFKAVDQAQEAGGGLARTLSTFGSLLPRSVGSPLLSAANQLRQRQVRVRQVRWYSKRFGQLRGRAGTRQRQPSAVQPLRRAGSQVWSETPSVRPGYTLAVDLMLRSVGSHEHRVRPFRVVSRSDSGTEVPPIIEEGNIEIPGGFWARRFLPQVVLLITAAALLALAAWLASTSVL